MIAHSAPSLLKSGHFTISKQDGVQYLDPERTVLVPVCSFLTVDAITADPHNQNWGKLVSFNDPTGEQKQHHVLNASLTANARGIVSELVSRGLDLAGHPRASNLLIQYVRSTTPKARMISSPKPGW